MESTSEEEFVQSTKPTFYPHSFKARESKYEVDDFVGDMMGKLQEERFRVTSGVAYDLGLLQLLDDLSGGDGDGSVCVQPVTARMAGDANVSAVYEERDGRGRSSRDGDWYANEMGMT